MIADFDVTSAMLEYFIKKSCNSNPWSKPYVVICIPSGVTEVEKRAVKEASRNAGAKQVWVIEEPMAAAFGAGLLPLGAAAFCSPGSVPVGSLGAGAALGAALRTVLPPTVMPTVRMPPPYSAWVP